MDPVYGTCDTLITAVEEQGALENGVQVSHDAMAGSLIVRADGMDASARSIVLLSGDGRLVKQQNVTIALSSGARLEIGAIASGAYTVLVMDGRAVLASGWVVLP